MTDFLNSLKADLLDRRMLPLLVVLSLALVGALAYTVLGGSTPSSPPAAAVPSARVAGIAVSPAPANPNQPVAETVVGSAQQRGGATRDPFIPLPTPKNKLAAVPTTKTAAPAASTKSGAGNSTSSTPTTTTKTAPTKPTIPAKPKTVYHVAVLFGVPPAGAPPLTAQLQRYDDLKRLAPLPSAKQPMVQLYGVTAGGKAAVFMLIGEAILHGTATCLPSASQCQGLQLKPGQYEQFEYLPPTGGPAVSYELRIASIVSTAASTADFKRVTANESKAGRELLRKSGLKGLPGMTFSPNAGVLVFASHPASVARAHAAAQRSRH